MLWLRLLIILALIVLVLRLARRWRGGDRGATPSGEFEPTVQCAQCGAHTPRKSATEFKGRFYCRRHAPHD